MTCPSMTTVAGPSRLRPLKHLTRVMAVFCTDPVSLMGRLLRRAWKCGVTSLCGSAEGGDVLLQIFIVSHSGVGVARCVGRGGAVEGPWIVECSWTNVAGVPVHQLAAHGLLLLRGGPVVQRGGNPVFRSVWNMVFRDGHFGSEDGSLDPKFAY